MLITITVAAKDQALALQTLAWAAELGREDYDCLLGIGKGVDAEPLLRAARKVFRTVTPLPIEVPQDTWPWNKNAAFQEVARHIFEAVRAGRMAHKSWLWFEPDCTPLKKGWMATLAKAHLDGGKPFSGHVYAVGYMACVGIYPWNFLELSPERGMLCRQGPWDQCAAADVNYAGVTPINHLLQDVPTGSDGFPPTFPDKESLALLKPDAVLFHKCKDGSLIGQLSTGRWKRLFESFRSAPKPMASPVQPEVFFQMGRFGDLILLLPAFKEYADRTGRLPVVVTSEAYASVLEGASYVRPFILPHHWFHGSGEALAFARTLYPNIRRTQLYGGGLGPVKKESSFSLSMWNMAGLMPEYHRLSLMFDQRSPAREAELVARYQKPFVLVNFQAETSPLPCAPALLKRLRERFPIVETPQAHRIYDLLGLMDAAAGLITIDTATTHLAAASPVRALHLVRDDGAAGSLPKGNVAGVIGYSQVTKKFYEIVATVEGWL